MVDTIRYSFVPSERRRRTVTLIKQVQESAERFHARFDDLAAAINARAEEIHETRVERERLQQELEREREQAEYTRNRDRGWDYGL